MLRTAILHECQHYLGGGGRFGRKREKYFSTGQMGIATSYQYGVFSWGEGYCHIGYIGMCRCEGNGFQAVYSGIGYINQRVWV